MKIKAEKRFPAKTLGFSLVIIVSIVGSLTATTLVSQETNAEFAKNQILLTQDIQKVRYFGEMLSTSARLAAWTHDLKYESGYHTYAVQLDDAMRQIQQLYPSVDMRLEETGAANLALARLQLKSFALDRAGQFDAATTLLTGPDYLQQQDLYQNGLNRSLGSIESARFAVDREGITSERRTLALGLAAIFVVIAMAMFSWQAARRWGKDRASMQELTKTAADLTRTNALVTTLANMGNLLEACTGITEATDVIEHIAPQLFGVPGGLYLTNASGNLVEETCEWGEGEKSQHLFSPQECWALRSGQTHVVDRGGGPSCAHVKHAEEGYLCAPLSAQGEVLGVLVLIGNVEGGLQFVSAAADQVGLSLANLDLRERLRGQSIRDPLTGLFNRRYMEECLERELRRAQRSGRALSVIMADLDHFKGFNDEFGHEAGDKALQMVGRVLRESVREEDIACRYGGEELLLILPEAGLQDAAKRADIIRGAVGQLSLDQGRNITISLGVAAVADNISQASELVASADRALYQAKSQGRNRVVAAASPEESAPARPGPLVPA